MDEELLYTQEDIDEWVRTCEELQEKRKEQEETIEQLSEYKRLEEQGLIVRLPCKFGSKFYHLCYDEIIEKDVYDISFDADGNIRISSGDGVYYYLGAYGNEIFFTLEEAEKRLKENEKC